MSHRRGTTERKAHSRWWRGVVALTVAALTFTVAPSAVASTPAGVELQDGETYSYVINSVSTGSSAVRTVARAVDRAFGAVVQSWPEIGVVIARSDSATFLRDLRTELGDDLASAGHTRTVPVTDDVSAETTTTRASHNSWNESNGDVPAAATPNVSPDPAAAKQWDMTFIGADKAAAVSNGSPNVLVGVLDGGIDPSHPDLKEQIDQAASVNCTDGGQPNTSAYSWQATSSDHGTHVAGTIAAARNGVGMTGVAPGVRLSSVKVVDDDGLIYAEYAVCGFMWAGRQGMDVTNSSYYVDPFLFACPDQANQAAALQAVRRAVAWSNRVGVVHIAAAGNEGTDLSELRRDTVSPNDSIPTSRRIDDSCVSLPAMLPEVVSVGAVTSSSTLAGFSNYGMGQVDIVAPGVDILSTINDDDSWGTKSGTSMASPHVAGVAALIVSTHPSWTPAQVREKLLADAQPMACPAVNSTPAPTLECADEGGVTNLFGHGLVNAEAAVQP